MIEVYKYGGNLLKDSNNRKAIYDFIKDKNKQGVKIIMVVSAFGREGDSFSTDNLSRNIELLDKRDKDQVMTFGEIYSSLIIKNELLREGIKASNLYYDEIGIMCDDNYQNGNILSINMNYLEEVIDGCDVVVVPGFIGESSEGKIISLGRNTSDLTGVIIAKFFDLECVNIIKEVDGVFKKDPKKGESKFIERLSYDEMIAMVKAGSSMFSLKTLKFAKDNNVTIRVKGLGKESYSEISKVSSNEDILFINKQEDEVKVVFKNMDIFNELFRCMVEEKVSLEELVISNNIVYLKGNEDRIMEILNKYL